MRPFPMEPHEFWPALALLLALGAAVLVERWVAEWRWYRRRVRPRVRQLRRYHDWDRGL